MCIETASQEYASEIISLHDQGLTSAMLIRKLSMPIQSCAHCQINNTVKFTWHPLGSEKATLDQWIID